MPLMLRSLLWLPGALMVVAVLLDLIVTCIQTGEGRLSRAIHRPLYGLLRRAAHHSGRRALLSWATPVIITGTLTAWTLLTWLGWTLIFWSHPGALVGAESGQPATFVACFYFVGYTISTLGLGEIIAPQAFWRVMTDVAAINGFFLLTFAITFVVPIAQARTERRELALLLHRAGPGAQALIVNAVQDHDRGLSSLTGDLQHLLNRLDAAHLNTPYLHRFHDHDRQDALDLHLPALGEALLIIQGALRGDCPRGLKRALASVDSLSRTFERTQSRHPLLRAAEVPPTPDLTSLREAGLPLRSREAFREDLRSHAALRARLHAMARAGEWRWDQVATPEADERMAD
ncbi:hypothetical protein SY84_01110 [Deinococcus soli (ex Cha et al. 2016)]|uniref:Potassium channel domain-containing protein n=2 Tax=Deinococcus soli (ex Cha et al. 2016) TaxID=1309411 RepID=A0A0F7JSB0_9DEIO|nr:hypothetical protein SY84_01110 [Deinococcus soli (ex Cha et al. 2016)]